MEVALYVAHGEKGGVFPPACRGRDDRLPTADAPFAILNLITVFFNLRADLRVLLKGGPEPLEKEIHEILGSKREDRFSDPFFDWVQHTSLVRFLYLLRLSNFCKAPRDMRKFPQKCQKIAGC